MTGGARGLAHRALVRIERDRAFANIVLPTMLGRSDLDGRDRRFATELVYGTTRMRRACDWLVDRFLATPPPVEAMTALRLGAYQLAFLDVPAHAAVDGSVSLVGKRHRGLVNAVLRRVADADRDWPDEATRLSYPDWIVERLTADLGRDDAVAALERMNEPASVTERPDGYIQDLASQWVAEIVGGESGERVLDACAAPGGKATAIAARGATVTAVDLRPKRAAVVAVNANRLGLADRVGTAVADARRLPVRPAVFAGVVVDAPCSGLGVLRRRPDARWRIEPEALGRLPRLQNELLTEAAACVAPGGRLVYSVCTVTTTETVGVAERFTSSHPSFAPGAIEGPRWRSHGTGGLILPHDHDTDGMAVFVWRRAE